MAAQERANCQDWWKPFAATPDSTTRRSARRVGARTRYLNMPKVEMADSMCSGYRKTAKWFTSREVRLIVNHLGEPPGSSRAEQHVKSYGIVW